MSQIHDQQKSFMHSAAVGLIQNAVRLGRAGATNRLLSSYGDQIDTMSKAVDEEFADQQTDKEREASARGHGKTHPVTDDKTGTLDTNVDEDDGEEVEKGGKGSGRHKTGDHVMYNGKRYSVGRRVKNGTPIRYLHNTDGSSAYGKDKRQIEAHEDDLKKIDDLGRIEKAFEKSRNADSYNRTYDSGMQQLTYNRDLLKQAVAAKVKPEETIEKSHQAVDSLMYNAKLTKSGKEVKGKLATVKAGIVKNRDAAKKDYESLRKKIKEEPKQNYGDWRTREIGAKLPELPNSYEWGQINPKNNGMQPVDFTYSADAKKDAQEVAQGYLMQQYNNAVYKYVDACIDIVNIETLMNNLTDDQQIELSPANVTALGF